MFAALHGRSWQLFYRGIHTWLLFCTDGILPPDNHFEANVLATRDGSTGDDSAHGSAGGLNSAWRAAERADAPRRCDNITQVALPATSTAGTPYVHARNDGV